MPSGIHPHPEVHASSPRKHAVGPSGHPPDPRLGVSSTPLLHLSEQPDALGNFPDEEQRTADGQRLPVDIVAWAKEQQEAQALLDRALGEFKTQAHEKGSEVEIVD